MKRINKALDKFVDTRLGHAVVIVVATVGAIAAASYMLVSGWIDGSLKEFWKNSR
jgi:ABC-type transport system involved in cytochrome bd biosynthesis fused ATPase/permease subunit